MDLWILNIDVDLSCDTFHGGNSYSTVQKPEEATKGAKDEPGEGGGKGGLGRGCWSYHEGRSISLIMKVDQFLVP